MSPDITMKYTADIAAVKAALEKATLSADKTDEKIDEVKKKADEVNKSLINLDEQAEKSLKTGLSVARRGVLLMQLFTSGTKNAVTKSMVVMSQAVLIAAETALAIATASSFTVVGAVNAALGFAAFASLVMQAQQIAAFGVRAGQQFDDLDRAVRAGNIVFAGW